MYSKAFQYLTINSSDDKHLSNSSCLDDAKSFRSLVFSNPHFLVTSSDTCTILHDGARYNALHLCAQKNRKLVALTLIKTISSNEFWQLIYPHDSDCSRMNRMNYMLDMYLNTPDKHCGETALHFAAKFGFNSMLELLASHPRTIRNTVNSNNLKPGQVAGVRCSGFAPKFKIDQGPFYVCCSVCDSDLSMFKFVVSGPKSPSDNFELGSTQARKVKDLVTLETDFVTDAYIGPTFEVKCKAIQNDLNKLKRSILTSSDSKLGKYLKYRIGRFKICNEHKVRLKERFLISDTFLEISEEFILGILKRCELFLQRENNSFFATSDLLESFACFNTTSCQANNSLADSSLGSLTSSFANLNLNASFQRSFNLNDSLMPGINEISEALMRANESLNNISDLDLINDGQNASSCSENNDDPEDFKTPPGSPDLSFVDAINSPFISFCNCKATDFWDQSNNLLVLNNHLVCQYFDILRQTDHYECELFPFMQVWTESFKLYSKDMLADKRVKISMHCKSCSFCPNDIDVRFSEFVSLSDFEFDPFCLNLTWYRI